MLQYGCLKRWYDGNVVCSYMEPKILVIVDVPGWALKRTADNEIARLKEHYAFDKAFNKNAADKIRAGRFDLLYVT